MSDDQEIHVEDLCTEKKYFSQIPNIIHRMGLGCYVVAYYCLLKSIAGDSGHCFTGQKKLAKSLGCSDRHIRKMNAFMSKPFEILGGKPLIKITYRKNEDGEPIPNLIHVTDIWLENVMVLNEKKPIPQTSMSNEKPKIKKSNVAERSSTPSEPYSPPPDSSSYKEEPFKKTQSKKKDIRDLGDETEIVYKSKKRNLDAKRRWKLTDQEVETFLSVQALGITDKKGEPLKEGKIAFWAKNFILDRILDVYHESKAYKPECMKSYMSKLLDENKKVPNANAEANREFAREYLESNEWAGVKIFKNYIRYPLDSDFGELDFNMDPVDFIYRFIEKHENTQN